MLSAGTTTSRVRMSEDGSRTTVDVTLATQPTGDVVINVAGTDTAQGTVSPAMPTFVMSDWNTAQTVTLTEVDDPLPGSANGCRNYTVTLTVDIGASADANYNSLSTVTITPATSTTRRVWRGRRRRV